MALLVLLYAEAPLAGQADRSKTLERSYKGKEIVDVSHRYGSLVVMPSRDGQVRYEATLSVEGGSDEAIKAVFDHFEVSVKESGEALDIETRFGIRQWNNINGVTRLEFEDGVKVRDLKGIKATMTVFVPNNLSELRLSNKYDDIQLQADPGGKVSVELYSGQLEAGNLKGDLSLDMKYSKGKAGNFGDGTLKLYDSNFSLGNGKRVTIDSKYSKINTGATQSLTITSYDDEMALGDVSGPVSITDKYSDIRFGTFQSARLNVYDSNITTDGGEALQARSKYTEFQVKKLGTLVFEESYDDEVVVESLGSLSANSKYTEYTITTLARELRLDSYDDEVKVGQVAGPLDAVTFNGKYTDLSLKLPAEQAFNLEANLTYGRLVVPDSRMETQVHKVLNDRTEFRGKTKGAKEESPKITIVAYDGKITLN